MKNEKEKMELTPKTPETGNPFRMMRRFTKDARLAGCLTSHNEAGNRFRLDGRFRRNRV